MAAVVASGCAVTGVDAASSEVADADLTSNAELVWRAELFPREMNGVVEGDALVATGVGDRSFKATVVIRYDRPAEKRPWRVNYGSCQNMGKTIGDASAYARLSTNADGEATRTAFIAGVLDTTAAYNVTVHFSDGDMYRIIACGDLSM